MSGLDTLLAIALVFVCAVPIGLAGAWFTARGPSAMAGFFRPGAVADLGWPVGVQEEDAPAWNWDPPAAPAASQPDVTTELVELEAGAGARAAAVRRARINRA